MRQRKTVTIDRLRESVNNALANADYQDTHMGVEAAKAFRQGVAAVLETALHETGNYRGFRIVAPEAGRTPEGYLIEGTYDDTRRAYY